MVKRCSHKLRGDFVCSPSDINPVIKRDGIMIKNSVPVNPKRDEFFRNLYTDDIDIIENKYADQELSLLSVSSEIGVSPNYLSTLIKKNTGRTFVELLTDRRIRKARELLLGTTMKIREITEACGYRDQFYFSHCFKKITGMSPKECRRANEQKQE